MNPLLSRHLYSSARRNRFFWLLTIYLLAIGLLTLAFTLLSDVSSWFTEDSYISILDLFTQGRSIFWFSGIVLLLTAGLLVPINALGALSGEKENRTLALLTTTTLKSRDIVLGKVGSALMTGAIYVLSPLPLLMAGYWIGGVTTTELLLTMLFLGLTMLLNIAWAIFVSSMVRKTIAAVILFYGTQVALVPILSVIFGILVSIIDSWQYSMSRAAYLPFWLNAVIQCGWVILIGLHPISAAIGTEALGLDRGWGFLEFTIEHRVATGPASITTVWLPSPWITFTVTTLITVAILLWRTSVRLKKPERR
ncbi:MAG: hypothetical protein JXA21_04200 [Anaerolineae bacterium]|nr:hypothetical protein [Anaerolineae bacterium]